MAGEANGGGVARKVARVPSLQKHYLRPDREQFKTAFNQAMPEVLTGGTAQSPTPAEELRLLADKVAAGTATAVDRKCLRVVAAMV